MGGYPNPHYFALVISDIGPPPFGKIADQYYGKRNAKI